LRLDLYRPVARPLVGIRLALAERAAAGQVPIVRPALLDRFKDP